MTKPETPSSGVDLADRRVLVIEDDPTVSEVVQAYLLNAGFLVDVAADSFAGLEMIRGTEPDLIVLDRMLPGISGTDLCRRVRETSAVPVIMLTALGEAEGRIEGLEAGADDYVTKPFSPRELVLRVQAIMRRSLAPFTPESPFVLGEYRLDPSARRVERNGTELELSGREFDLFAFLLKHPRQTFDRQTLLKHVWGWEVGDLSTVTVTVRRLREKIEDDPGSPAALSTVWGVGYRLDIGD